MTLTFYALVTVIPMLGILILVHEFGHFAAAKLFGVRVEVFSIGFGKRLVGFRRGDTDYRISALPFGGYVKMAGENPAEEHSGSADEFSAHPRWHRFVIALSGPFMNVLFAVVLLTGVFMVRYEHEWAQDQPADIGYVAENSPAAQAGLLPGDRIVQVGSVKDPVWEDVTNRILISPGQPLQIAYVRNGQRLQTTLTPRPENISGEQVGAAGLDPQQPVQVTRLEPGMPGEKAGLLEGDEIELVDGGVVRSTNALLAYLQETKDRPVALKVARGTQTLQISLTPAFDPANKEYRIGFASSPVAVDKLSFPQALRRSLEQNRKFSVLLLEIVRKMAERKVSIKQMSSPIGIGRMSGEMVQRPGGLMALLGFTALISVQLGIFNLLPIPILDGGLILLLFIEAVIRRDINEGVKVRIYQAAFVCLMIFASIVIFNDIVKMLPHRQ